MHSHCVHWRFGKHAIIILNKLDFLQYMLFIAFNILNELINNCVGLNDCSSDWKQQKQNTINKYKVKKKKNQDFFNLDFFLAPA